MVPEKRMKELDYSILSERIVKKMKLYIIGNGFDLGHNLHTKYWDFIANQ